MPKTRSLGITWPSLALAIVQFPTGWLVFYATHSARVFWTKEGGDMDLPLGLKWAIQFGMLIPFSVLVASAILLVVSWRRRLALTGVVLGLAICEIILLACFAYGLMIPGLWLLHRMGIG